MNLKNVEVMENTQKTNKNRFLPAGIGAGALMAGSWRHTPFRNASSFKLNGLSCSWRHTPFRKRLIAPPVLCACSWRHTPFRKVQFVP